MGTLALRSIPPLSIVISLLSMCFFCKYQNRTTTQSPAVKRWGISTSEISNNRKQAPIVVTTLSTTTRAPPTVATTLKTTSRPVMTTTRPTPTTTLRTTQRPTTTTRPTVTTTLKTTQRPTMVTTRPTTTTTLKTTQRPTTTTTRPTTTTTLKTTQRSTTATTRPTTTTTLKTTKRPTVATTRPTTTTTLKTTSKPAVTTTTPITTTLKATTRPTTTTTVTIPTTKPHVVITAEKITPHTATTTAKTTAAPIVTVTYSDFGSQRFRESGTAEGMHRERDKAVVIPCSCEYGGLLHSSFIIFMWICLLFLIISFLVFALYMLRKLQLLKMGGGNNNDNGNELDGDGDASLSSSVEVLDRYSQPPSKNNGYENLSSQKCMSFRPGKFALASLSPVRGMGETVETTRALKSIMGGDGDGGRNEAQVDGNVINSIQTNIKTSTLGPSNCQPSAFTWSESELASRARSLSPPPMEYKNLVSPSLIRQAHQTEMESQIIPNLSIQQDENENEGDQDNNQKDYSWAEEINRMQTTRSKRLISNTNTDSNTNSGGSDCTSTTGNYTETSQKQVSRTEQAPVGVGDPVDEIMSCHQNENQDLQSPQQQQKQQELQQRQDVKRSDDDDGYYQTTITDMDLMSRGNTNRNDEIDRKALETATSGKTFQNGVEITTVTTTRKIITTTTATASGEIQKQEEIIDLPEDIQIMNDVDDYFKFIDED